MAGWAPGPPLVVARPCFRSLFFAILGNCVHLAPKIRNLLVRISDRLGMKTILLFWCVLLPTGLRAQSYDAHERQLLHMHSELIRAHLEGRVELWMSLESDEYISVNRGHITSPSPDERERQRTAYLEGATFTAYRDLREPLVRVSQDGTMGWLMAEVEVSGTAPGPAGDRVSFQDVWAWVELYEMTEGGWRMVGNASNRRGT